jgi:HIRAN domain
MIISLNTNALKPPVTKLANIMGSTFFGGATDFITRLRPGSQLTLVREPRNKYDPNAIRVMYGNRSLGYVPRGLASELAGRMDTGLKVSAIRAPNQGCVMKVSYVD